MDLVFSDSIGHSMLSALKELGEGLNKLAALERQISKNDQSAAGDDNEFDILQVVESSSFARFQQQDTYYDASADSLEPPLSPPTSCPNEDLKHAMPARAHSSESAGFEYTPSCGDEEDGSVPGPPSEDYPEDEEGGEDSAECDNDRVDDDDEDEWENDDDMGYYQILVSEQDFFEMEEEAAFRLSLRRVGRRQRDSRCEDGEGEPPSDEDDECQGETLGGDDGDLNASFSHGEGGRFSLDLRANSPRIEPSDDADVSVESAGSSVHTGDNDTNDLETDLKMVELQLEDGSLSIPQPATRNSHLSVDDESEADGSAEDEAVAPMGQFYSCGTAGRRGSEIMGQRKIEGIDGEHRYFDLKVIFDPYRTGFEEDKHFNPLPGTIVAGRYEVVEMLGQATSAAFSTAWQCIDLDAEEEEAQWVCLKVIKNSKDFFDQSLDEIKLLQYINSRGDPHKNNVLKLTDFFYCKEHLFIVSELLRENLYEFGKYIRESGAKEYFTLPRLKKIMKQMLEALVYIHSLNLIHCDIKPENIVIRSYSKCQVKLIDFGSSCFTTDHLTSYIQSRSYRAPEVILGLEYGAGIDIWSLGAVLAEMYTGYVLFQNDSISTMLARIDGIVGPYPEYMLEEGREAPRFYSNSGVFYDRIGEEGETVVSLIYPKKTSLRRRLHLPRQGTRDEELFLDFVKCTLQIDPSLRPSAKTALLHEWFDDVDTLDVHYQDD
mmetsp:Transcript_15756/g.23682  ORF Transcript_15756/g.23682 Transcript_15756/m.23682 type:complete len:717 (-) Transcript_15756:295-2445(-)